MVADEQIADEIHALVRDATLGDRRAITIIVLAYQPTRRPCGARRRRLR